jgi:hypothetical protein
MRFEPNDDQAAFLSVVDQMAASPEADWKASAAWARYDWSDALDGMLADAGFYDCAAEETLGAAAAAAMVMRLNALPVAVESAASSLLRPLLGLDLPRPIAVIEGEADRAIRFLPVARSVVLLGGEGIRTGIIQDGMVEPVTSLFAYPMGLLKAAGADWRSHDVDPEAIWTRWRVALAAEMAGSLRGGLASVLQHVRDRRQFGRPLGSFQAVQHRLAGCSVRIEAASLLVLKAAQTGEAVDAAIALGHAEQAATGVVYDLHQFMGAMGLTLEHPLHRWTYRVKLLRSALGGAHNQQRRVADLAWGKR